MAQSSKAAEAQEDLISVYLRQWHLLQGRIRNYTGNHELADDAMQETWFRLDKIKSRPVMVHDKQAFVLRIAANIAIDLVRRESRHSSRCTSDETVLNAIADSYPSPEVFAIDRDQLRNLVTALTKLPPKPRSAMLLNRCDGLTHAQIAERLGVSKSMVARYLAQALRHCRDYFRAIE